MSKRTSQSNKVERCPLCFLRLSNRAVATSHYRAHARKGELYQDGEIGEGRHQRWAIPGKEWKAQPLWFERGLNHSWIDEWTSPEVYEKCREAWLHWLWSAQVLRKHIPAGTRYKYHYK